MAFAGSQNTEARPARIFPPCILGITQACPPASVGSTWKNEAEEEDTCRMPFAGQQRIKELQGLHNLMITLF